MRPNRQQRMRSYQAAAVRAVEQGLVPHRSVLIHMATGTGKTLVGMKVAHDAVRAGWSVLYLAHRDELLQQAMATSRALNARVGVGLVKAKVRQWNEPITVASVQSLGEQRLAELPGSIRLVVTDEGHHADAPSYTAIYERLRQLSPELRHLLMTATPYRAHKRERGQVVGIAQAEAQVFTYGLQGAINDGWLVEIQALAPLTGFHLAGLARDPVTGDFSAKAAEARLNHPAVHQIVVDHFLREVGRGKAIGFCTTIPHAKQLAAAFRARNIPAAAVWSNMDVERTGWNRDQVIRDYKSGRIRVLTNVGIVTEGFDDPSTNAAMMLRPTASLVNYSQMIGRATRLSPGKPVGLILDFCANTTALDLRAARLADLSETDLAESANKPHRPGSLMREVYAIRRRPVAA